MNWNRILCVTLFLTLAAFARNAGASKAASPPTTVFAEKAKETDLYQLLTYPAELSPKINATVLADSDGIVTRIDRPLGSAVGPGQALMVLKNPDPVYDYKPVTVLAPVRGIVSSIEVTVGSRVNKGDKLLTIMDPKKIKILVEIAASDLAAIHRGLTGDLKFSGQDASFPVKVVGISPFIDPATGTATAELALDHAKTTSATLPPGLIGQVSFKAADHQGVEVPESAILYQGSDTLVRLIENGKAKFSPVSLGPTQQGLVEITKGVKPGDMVIIRTSSYVADGEAVNVQSTPGAPAS